MVKHCSWQSNHRTLELVSTDVNDAIALSLYACISVNDEDIFFNDIKTSFILLE